MSSQEAPVRVMAALVTAWRTSKLPALRPQRVPCCLICAWCLGGTECGVM